MTNGHHGSALFGKVAVVTGAGSGIGAAAALRFAAEGASVAVIDIRAEAAQETADRIAKEQGQAIAIAADVSSAAALEEAMDRVMREFGGIDVLYNNAGVDSSGSVSVAEEADWDRCMTINVKGTFLASRAALRHMDDGGSIINQGSVAGLVGIPNFAAYCAAKGAVIALTRQMAIDLAPRRIRVNVICPGTVYTPLMEPMLRARGDGDLEAGLAKTILKYPIGRLGAPEEIANVALFLACGQSSFMTGSVLTTDGGMTAQ
ncbi:SDR family NAD(P)-dependent oxidoreductase [Pseudonocardia sp. GCM10023141]|uniref:SDR family NAD(P)-dependent oxidoreductase n=1 Tax=Pseudonocardia sp. GCM10023141 TaxID=3252653 RepID=UPI00360ACE11